MAQIETSLPETLGPVIDGVRTVGGGRTFDVVDPYRRERVLTVTASDASQVELAVERARMTQPDVAAMSRRERATILEGAASRLLARLDDVAAEISRQTGKALKESRREVTRAGATLEASARAATEGADRWLPADEGPGGEGLVAMETRRPVGVVGAISPFNAPLNLAAHKVGPAIASGNAVVLKPSSFAPLAAVRLAEAFFDAGLPPGALAIVTGGAEVGQALVSHPDVRFVSFTGGRAAGDAVRTAAGGKPVAMELGGNAAAIVHEDADVEQAATALTWGAFGNTGQSCNSTQRIFVAEARWDDFLGSYLEGAGRLRTGDPLDPETDVGTLVTEAEAVRVERTVASACDDGASIVLGGARRHAAYAPTIVTGVRDRHPLACDEIFGPVVSLFPYRELGDALALANGTEYGLTGAVFTRSLAVAARVASELEVGVVNVNRSPNYRLDHLPYGGVKGSGVGREGPRYAAQEMTVRRLVLVDPGVA